MSVQEVIMPLNILIRKSLQVHLLLYFAAPGLGYEADGYKSLRYS